MRVNALVTTVEINSVTTIGIRLALCLADAESGNPLSYVSSNLGNFQVHKTYVPCILLII